MQIEKLMKAALAASVVVLLSASAGAQSPSTATAKAVNAPNAAQAVPKSKDVMQLLQKALGGDAFFEPSPYTMTLSTKSDDSYDGKKEAKYACTYKEGKYIEDGKLAIKGMLITIKSINDLNKGECWYSENGGAFRKDNDPSYPVLNYLNKKQFDDITFVFEFSDVVEDGGKKYYKVNGRTGKKDLYNVTYFISTDDNLVYKKELSQVKGPVKQTTVFSNYLTTLGIAIPQTIIIDATLKSLVPLIGKLAKSHIEHRISDFKFRDDIPDSLFVVPKK